MHRNKKLYGNQMEVNTVPICTKNHDRLITSAYWSSESIHYVKAVGAIPT